MKIILCIAVGAFLGWVAGLALDNGMGKWLALAAFLIVSAVLFVEFFTRPGVRRNGGRK